MYKIEIDHLKKLDTELNKLLYLLDPENTSCKENEMHDEYELESVEIVKFIATYLNCLNVVDQENIDNSVLKGCSITFKESFDSDFTLRNKVDKKIFDFLKEQVSYFVINGEFNGI